MKTISIKGYNDFELIGYVWDNVEQPSGIVQVIHGMQEHAKRYNEFAKYLNKQGLIVFACDLRGHGQTAISNNMMQGYSDGDIFSEIVQDQIIITNYLIATYKLPVTIFGHSFGSFITQRYMVENSFKIKNVIMCGTTFTNSFHYRLGYHIAKIAIFFKGKKSPAKLIEKMSFGKYGKKFKSGNWLSRDEKNWQNYQNDELCGKTFPNNFYYSFFKNARNNYKKLSNIPYYLPILIISGSDDVVSGKKGLFKLFIEYGKAKKKVYLKNYLNARHELLHETNKAEVYSDVTFFAINNKLDFVPVKLT